MKKYPKLNKMEQTVLTQRLRNYGIGKFLTDLAIKTPYKTTPFGDITRANLHRVYSGRGGINPVLAKAICEFFDEDPSLSFLVAYSQGCTEEDLQKKESLIESRISISPDVAYMLLFDASIKELRERYFALENEKRREFIGVLEKLCLEEEP